MSTTPEAGNDDLTITIPQENLATPILKEDIKIPFTPLYCFQHLASRKKSIKLDQPEKAKLFDLLIELSDRSASMGLHQALITWTGKDYKPRNDWSNTYGKGRDYYSLRVHNKSDLRVCNSQSDVTETTTSVVFKIWDVVNEKN